MKFKMNGILYEIKEMTQKEYKKYRKNEDIITCCEETDTSKGMYFGATHNYQNIIFLDSGMPLDRKRRTLIHELIHCYIAEYITHEEEQFSEENVADIGANSHDIIHQIVEDYFNKNKTMMELLKEKRNIE